jgi:hypothetical protein
MTKEKHYFDKGVAARPGIEYWDIRYKTKKGDIKYKIKTWDIRFETWELRDESVFGLNFLLLGKDLKNPP